MRKRILFTAIAFLALTLQSRAQKFLEIYQDGVVINRIQASVVDSITVEETVPPTINMWHNGDIFLSYYYNDIDSIKVSYEDYPVSYIGVMGFNDDLYRKGIGILSPSTAGSYKSFINSIPQDDGSLLYYAVDNALDILEETDITTPLKSVHFITFTDGLDLGSIMMQDDYLSTRDYLNAMSNRIRKTQIEDLPLNAYTVGLRGKDVTDVEQFRNNLVSLASTEDNAFEVSNIDGLRSRLREIANKIINVSTRQTVSVKIPGTDNGTRMRFVFDGKTASESSLYIEGTFNLRDRLLYDVSYHGMKARSGSTVQGTQVGIFVTFTFTGLQRLDGNGVIPMGNIKHYYLTSNTSNWQKNSEFKPDNNTQQSFTYTGTSLFLVLDCSSSLGSDSINTIKSYANEFIDMLAGNVLPVVMNIPQHVTATMDPNDFAVNVSWDVVKYAKSYKVFRSNSSGTNILVADNITSTNWKDRNPSVGNNSYRVSAVRYDLESGQSSSESVTCSFDAPKNVKATLADNDFVVNVTWDAVTYAKSYKVFRSNSSSGAYTLVAENITSTTWTDTNPNAGDNYYKVIAVCGEIESSLSNYAYVKYSLNAPQNVKATLADNDFVVNVTWDAVTYAKSYKVFRSNSSSGAYTLVAENITSTKWVDRNPLNGNNYYKVCAVCGEMESSQSNYAYVEYDRPLCPDGNHPHMIDLGLPDGTKWACCNVGATSPESYGGYFAWGEIEEKDCYDWSTYLYCNGAYDTMTKYCTNSYYGYNGFTDGLTELLPEDDAATANWGSSWRIPTIMQLFDLITSEYTTTEWTTLNGVIGRKITSKSNGNCLFLPAAGYRHNTTLDGAGSAGIYFSRSLYTDYSYNAFGLDFYSGNIGVSCYDRRSGRSIRPVRVQNFTPSETTTYTVNGVLLKMVAVEGGTFTMGATSEQGDDAYDNEKPAHEVTLDGFSIGETEVTQELWEAVMGSNPSYFKGNKLPVEQVSWNDCQTFITKLNQLTGQSFRLPTEAEWEYAARGGTSTSLYNGENIDILGKNNSPNLDPLAWYGGNCGQDYTENAGCDVSHGYDISGWSDKQYNDSKGGTHPVGQKQPNAYGLYDMLGNAREWCQDWYGSYSSSTQTNPTGPTSGYYRVLRGGSWSNYAESCRVSSRDGYTSSSKGNNLGFRLAQ